MIGFFFLFFSLVRFFISIGFFFLVRFLLFSKDIRIHPKKAFFLRLCLRVFLCFSFGSFLYAQENQLLETQKISTEFRVQVSNIQGTVEYRREVSRFKTLRFGQILMEGSIIRLEEESYLELILWNNRRIQFYPNTEFRLQKLEESTLNIELREGKLGLLPVDEKEEVFFFIAETPLSTIESKYNENQILVDYRDQRQLVRVFSGLIFATIQSMKKKDSTQTTDQIINQTIDQKDRVEDTQNTQSTENTKNTEDTQDIQEKSPVDQENLDSLRANSSFSSESVDLERVDSERTEAMNPPVNPSLLSVYGGLVWILSNALILETTELENEIENEIENEDGLKSAIREEPIVEKSIVEKSVREKSVGEENLDQTLLEKELASNGGRIRNLQEQEIESAKKEEGLFRRGRNLSKHDYNFIVQIEEDDPFFRTPSITLERKIQNIRDWRSTRLFYWKFDFATSYIEKNFYFSLGWYPNLTYRGFSGQLRFLIHFPFTNPIRYENWYNYSEWDFQDTKDIFEDLASKIDWISYAPESSVLNLWVGRLEEKSYGYGMVMRDYRNSLEEPSHRRAGISLEMRARNTQFSIFLADITRSKILSIYIQSQPFLTAAEKEQEIDSLELGFGLSMDLAPRKEGGNPQVFFGSLDFRYPFINLQPLTLAVFVEGMIPAYSFQDIGESKLLNQTTSGFRFLENQFALAAGIKGKVLGMFGYEFQYRYLSEGSISEYFDLFYESERISKVLSLLSSKSTLHGFLTQFSAEIERIGMLQIEYYHKIAENSPQKSQNRFRAELRASMHLDPFVAFHTIYERKNISSFIDFFSRFMDSESYMDSKISYSPIQNIEISLLYRYFFKREPVKPEEKGFVENWDNRHFISLRGLFIF